MRKVMERGKRLPSHVDSLEAIRENAKREKAILPERLRGLVPAVPAYPVEVSETLRRYQERVISEVARP
jgi:nicotinate phosphoribosyltransferase